jgi:IS30 family transposase
MNNYTHIWEKERKIIYLWLQKGLKQKEIAQELKRAPSSISREIKRNRSLLWQRLNNNIKAKINDENYHYLPDKANEKYKKRKKQAWKMRPYVYCFFS